MKKIIAIVNKYKGRTRIQNAFSFNRSIRECPDGKYKITFEKHYNKASDLQFGYLYAVVYPHSIIALIQSGEEEFKTNDEVDVYWKMRFANREIVDRHTGEIMKLPLSKSQFKTIDQMAYCDQIRNFCAEWLDYMIPEPDPNWKETKNESK